MKIQLLRYNPEDMQLYGFTNAYDALNNINPQSESKTSYENDSKRCAVLLDTEEVTTLTSDIPGNDTETHKRAALYSLEDRLAERIDEFSSVIARKEKGKPYYIAVTKSLNITETLARLKEAEHPADMIIPDYALIPHKKGEWSILPKENVAIIRFHHRLACAVPYPLLQHIFDSLKTEYPPTEIGFIENMYTQKLMESYPVSEDRPRSIKHNLSDHVFSSEEYYELLSFAFYKKDGADKRERGRALGDWKNIAFLAFLSIFTTYVGLMHKKGTLESNIAVTDAEMINVYKTTFPNEVNIVMPKFQMQSKLNEQARSNNAGNAYKILTMISDAQKASRAGVHSVHYGGGQANINISFSSLDKMERFVRYLTDKNVDAKAENITTTQDNLSTATIKLIASGATGE